MLTANDLRNPITRLADDLVVCLCAEWCRTCLSYRDDFARLSEKHSQHHFIWLDIDADADLVGDLDVETFPTILVARRDAILFGGILLPHILHLDRLLGSLDGRPPEAPATATREFSAILTKLRGA